MQWVLTVRFLDEVDSHLASVVFRNLFHAKYHVLVADACGAAILCSAIFQSSIDKRNIYVRNDVESGAFQNDSDWEHAQKTRQNANRSIFGKCRHYRHRRSPDGTTGVWELWLIKYISQSAICEAKFEQIYVTVLHFSVCHEPGRVSMQPTC